MGYNKASKTSDSQKHFGFDVFFPEQKQDSDNWAAIILKEPWISCMWLKDSPSLWLPQSQVTHNLDMSLSQSQRFMTTQPCWQFSVTEHFSGSL